MLYGDQLDISIKVMVVWHRLRLGLSSMMLVLDARGTNFPDPIHMCELI